MNERLFRNTSILYTILMLVAAAAASSALPDGAGWDRRFLAFSSAATPWIICATIAWAASQVIKATVDRGKTD